MKSEVSGGVLQDVPGLASIPEALIAVADKLPDRIAFSEPDRNGNYHSITYRDLRKKVDSLARAILDRCEKPVVGLAIAGCVRCW